MADITSRPGVGDRAPRLELPDHGGRAVLVDPAVHLATVVVFTSHGCPYALAWHDRLQDVARDYAGRGVELVQVVSNDALTQPLDSREAMAGHVDAGEVAGLLLHDETQSAARSFGATATPEVFVLDAMGTIRYHGAPDEDWDDPSRRAGLLRAALEDVLEGREPHRPWSPPAGCGIKWRVELLWWSGCPSHGQAEDLLVSTLDAIGREDVRVARVEVTSLEEAAARAFPGSPTLQVGGRDLFEQPDAEPVLTCRTYRASSGRVRPLPAREDLEARLREVLVRPWELPGWVDFRKAGATS